MLYYIIIVVADLLIVAFRVVGLPYPEESNHCCISGKHILEISHN